MIMIKNISIIIINERKKLRLILFALCPSTFSSLLSSVGWKVSSWSSLSVTSALSSSVVLSSTLLELPKEELLESIVSELLLEEFPVSVLSGLITWSLIILTITLLSSTTISFRPSEVTILLIFIVVVPAIAVVFTRNLTCTTFSKVLLPTFLIATNSKVSGLYSNSSQSFNEIKSSGKTCSNIFWSYISLAL